MRRILFLVFILTGYAAAQGANTVMITFAGAPTGSCAFIQLGLNRATSDLYTCPLGTWHLVAGGGGSGTVTNTGTLTAGQLIIGNGGVDITVGNLSGDITTSGGTATTLKNTGSAGTYQQVTTDAQGRVTAGVTRTINTTSPLGGGGALSSDLTLTCTGCLTAAVTSIATTSPITGGTITGTGTIAINDAAADGSTKGAATFTAADFNASAGLISLDYTNGQKATGSVPGFLSAADWTTFNGKGAGSVTSIATTSPIAGGTITGTGTITCTTCVTSAASLTSNALVLGAGSQATAAAASLGTTTTVLHGNAAGAPSFASVTSSDVNNTIALTGTDINTSNQVTATHLAAALPVNQGGTGTTSTLTGVVRGGSPLTAAELSGDATTSGSNAVTVAKVNGVAYAASPSTDTSPIITASNTATYTAINNCGDSSHALAYSTSTHTYSCQSITGSAAAGGSDTQCQYNDATALNGATNCLYNKTTGVTQFNQKADTNETIQGKRFTDTTPTGDFFKFTDNAGTGTLFKLDVLGTMTLGGTTAGAMTMTAGTAAGHATASTVTIEAGATTTAYEITLPTAAATGVPLLTNTAGVVAMTIPATVAVAQGGTSLATLTTHALYVGAGTSAPTALSVGATNTLLHGITSSDPAFSAVVRGDVDSTVKGYSSVNVNSNAMSAAVTDTKLVEFSLQAGEWNVANLAPIVKASGTWTTGTTQTPTWNFKIKLCTVSGCGSGTVVTLCSWTSAASTASTTQTWITECNVGTTATGATGTVIAHGIADLPIGTTANTIFSGVHDVNTAASSGIDLTAALFVDIMANVSTQSGTKNSCTYHLAKIIP